MGLSDLPQELWTLCLEWVAISERDTTAGSAQRRMRDLALICKAWEVRYELMLFLERSRDTNARYITGDSHPSPVCRCMPLKAYICEAIL
jgi:hypothetical protein